MVLRFKSNCFFGLYPNWSPCQPPRAIVDRLWPLLSVPELGPSRTQAAL
jgi:hypothetical protein